jgi:hypothetical protein
MCCRIYSYTPAFHAIIIFQNLHTDDLIGLRSRHALAGGRMYKLALPPPVCAALPFCRLRPPMKIDQKPVYLQAVSTAETPRE